MNIDKMLHRVMSYSKILEKFKYIKEGRGLKPYSIKHINLDETVIEIRFSEWTYYDKDNNVIKTGPDPETLEIYLQEKDKLNGKTI